VVDAPARHARHRTQFASWFHGADDPALGRGCRRAPDGSLRYSGRRMTSGSSP
jgi:hypothetical protein